MRSYEYRIYPSKQQAEQLNAMLGDFCLLYNAGLEERISAYQRTGITLSYHDQALQLKACRELMPELSRWSFTALQQVLRRLNKSYQAFFRRVKRGEKAGFPRFQSRRRWDTAEFRFGDGLRLDKTQRLRIVGIDNRIKVLFHRELPFTPKTALVTRRAGRWFVIFQGEMPEQIVQPRKPCMVGIDVGLTSLVALSDGTKIATPHFFKDSQAKRRRLQRALSRKNHRSCGRRKARQNYARHSQKIAAQRRDFAHKLSRKLANSYTHIAVEDLNVKGLAQGMLSKSVHNAAWGQLMAYTTYKVENTGGVVEKVNPNGTSQLCTCGASVPKTLATRIHRCDRCGLVADRDVVSSQRVLARASFFCGGRCDP